MKAAKLAKHYIKLLNIPKDGEDAKLLNNYKVPSLRTGVEHTGDFSAVASLVLKDLLRSEPSTLTVGQINEHLNNLAQGGEYIRVIFIIICSLTH